MRTIGLIASGIFGALLILLGLAMFLRVLLGALDAAFPDPPRPPLAITRADFPVCVTPKPPPLLRTPDGRVDYRVGQRFNDKGIS